MGKNAKRRKARWKGSDISQPSCISDSTNSHLAVSEEKFLEQIDKILDNLVKTTWGVLALLAPVFMVTATSIFEGRNAIEYKVGGISINPIVAGYMISFAICAVLMNLVHLSYQLSDVFAQVKQSVPEAVAAIRRHSWILNPHADLADSAPQFLRVVARFLRPMMFSCFMASAVAPLIMLSILGQGKWDNFSLIDFFLLGFMTLTWCSSNLGVEKTEKLIAERTGESLVPFHLAQATIYITASVGIVWIGLQITMMS